MKSQISRWGNSLGMRIPKHIVEGLSLSANDEVDCRIEQGQIIVRPIQKLPKYTLTELLSQDLETEPEVDWGLPQGKEEW